MTGSDKKDVNKYLKIGGWYQVWFARVTTDTFSKFGLARVPCGARIYVVTTVDLGSLFW